MIRLIYEPKPADRPYDGGIERVEVVVDEAGRCADDVVAAFRRFLVAAGYAAESVDAALGGE